MRISSTARKFPLPPSEGWNIFEKKPKNPSKNFSINVDFLQSFSQIEPKLTDLCNICKAPIDPISKLCPICNFSKTKFENQLFFNSKIKPKPQAKIIFVLFDLNISEKEMDSTILNFRNVFEKYRFPDNFFLTFGFVSSFVTIFRPIKSTIHFKILDDPTISLFDFILPPQSFDFLKLAFNASSRFFKQTNKNLLGKTIFDVMEPFITKYGITDIVYFFKNDFNISVQLFNQNRNSTSSNTTTNTTNQSFNITNNCLMCNYHIIQINENQSNKNISDFCKDNVSLFLQNAEFTTEMAQRLLISVLKTVKVPLVLEFFNSPGYILSFKEHKFIEIVKKTNSTVLIIKQISPDLKITANIMCKKDYNSYNYFTLETCLTYYNLPPIVDIRNWEKAKDEADFANSSII